MIPTFERLEPPHEDATESARLLLAPVASGPVMLDVVHHVDLVTLCAALPDRSVDMILADLPYGTTACEWDEVIPFEPMWAAFKRVIKPRGAIVLTASQPFTSRLVMSNPGMFRYEWIWEKTMASGYPNSARQPLRAHESILVFSQASAINGFHKTSIAYYPQFSAGEPYVKRGKSGVAIFRGKESLLHDLIRGSIDGRRFPRSVFKRANPNAASAHPTQKPVALFEYLIRTYTRPGDVVLDPVCGSGTTAVACRNTGRRWICGDRELKYVNVAKDRLSKPFTLPFDALPPTHAAPDARQTAFAWR